MRIDVAELFAFCDLHASRMGLHAARRFIGVLTDWPRYFDRQGFPIPARDGVEPTLVWARMLESDPLLRNVAQSDFPDGSYLSTVWLGLDHGYGVRPLIFETMYFSGEVDEMMVPWSDNHAVPFHPTLEFPDPLGEQGEMTDQLRYGSEEEALAAHREIARRIGKRWEV